MDELDRIRRVVASGVPADALAFYGRWWQLETWLREVLYLELRARYGREWQEHLGDRPQRLADRDKVNAYMASADADDVLAYLDVFDLFGLVERHWELFEPLLPPQPRWRGNVDELRPLRNRIAHCRRPHVDDVERIEQLLRDLEPGARRFYAAAVDVRSAHHLERDPVAIAWVNGRHDDAARLLEHAERQYDVRLRLGYSVRPWAKGFSGNVVSSTPGVLWHARWTLGTGEVEPAELWERIDAYPGLHDLTVHVLLSSPWQAEVTFAAVDDAEDVADAIGNCFDALLMHPRRPRQHASSGTAEDAYDRWQRDGALLPSRVRLASLLSEFDPDVPLTVFSAARTPSTYAP